MYRADANGDRSDIWAHNANEVDRVSRIHVFTAGGEVYPKGCYMGAFAYQGS
ncbi:MAG: hypothetical protein KatS3mg057_1667 [Herpetosiphonaceae bacterium]|nr:MAG: hypothetical protein KatS3mg057_1667 [Herpetosiphonaceae bacterium]